MKIKELLTYLESIAPANYQESYDNSGLIVGDKNKELSGVLLCLDSTEAIIEEAIEKKCNLVIAHHPIVFRGLKRFNGKNYVERVVMKAIKNDVAIYACHTNLDNVRNGVNAKIASKLGLINTRILSPKSILIQITTQVEHSKSIKLQEALQGIGRINVLEGKEESQLRIVVENGRSHEVKNILKKEGLSFFTNEIKEKAGEIGSGMIGELREAIPEIDFLKQVKEKMQASCVRHTALLNRPVKKVAICGGAGGFLLGAAIGKGADVFVTADYKYHEFFDADGKIVIADIGHYETEHYTIELFSELIRQKFTNFALYCTEHNTNPVRYLF